MSSPMHSFLFSPPTSPSLTGSNKHESQVEIMTNHGLTSIKKLLLPSDMTATTPATAGMARAVSLDGNTSAYSPNLSASGPSTSELKVRSPRTPQQGGFATCQGMYPSASYPSPRGRYSRPAMVSIQVDDVDATPRGAGRASEPATPVNRNTRSSKVASSPGAANVPSARISIPTSLPRPMMRMLFLFSLIVSSALLLTYVPRSRLPSLRAAAMSRRLALHPDGRAYYELHEPAGSFAAARDRDYVAPKIMAPHMFKRSFHPEAPSSRTMAAQPVPATHELLALQSYLLDGQNELPFDFDPTVPLDATRFLGAGHRKSSSASHENAWAAELDSELGNDVVVWYGGDGNKQLPKAILDILKAMPLAADRVPTLMPCHSRADLPLLHSVLERLSVPLKHTNLVMIGNTPIIGGEDALEDLRLSGKLHELLASIGWIDAAPVKASKPRAAVLSEELD